MLYYTHFNNYIVYSESYILSWQIIMLVVVLVFMWHNLMRWCFWFNLGRKILCKARCWNVAYTYKEKSWTCCWMLSTCTKKKAGLVGFYLHVQRKKLDLLLDVVYVLQRKKLELFRYCKRFVEFNDCVQLNQGSN